MGNVSGNRSIIEVIVVDGHPSVREGLAAYLDTLEDMSLIAAASTGNTAVELCVRHRPDVVLLDLLNSGVDGIPTMHAIHQALPDVPIIAMVGWWQHELAEAALEAGAVTSLDKDVSGELLARAVRRAVGTHDDRSDALQPGDRRS